MSKSSCIVSYVKYVIFLRWFVIWIAKHWFGYSWDLWNGSCRLQNMKNLFNFGDDLDPDLRIFRSL